MEGNMGNNNDITVAKTLGYLEKATEDNAKQMEVLSGMLTSHMVKEEKERSSINNRLSLIFVGMAVILVKDTGASGVFGGVLKTFFPLIF